MSYACQVTTFTALGVSCPSVQCFTASWVWGLDFCPSVPPQRFIRLTGPLLASEYLPGWVGLLCTPCVSAGQGQCAASLGCSDWDCIFAQRSRKAQTWEMENENSQRLKWLIAKPQTNASTSLCSDHTLKATSQGNFTACCEDEDGQQTQLRLNPRPCNSQSRPSHCGVHKYLVFTPIEMLTLLD